jgi:hypothetical protein
MACAARQVAWKKHQDNLRRKAFERAKREDGRGDRWPDPGLAFNDDGGGGRGGGVGGGGGSSSSSMGGGFSLGGGGGISRRGATEIPF